MLFKKIANYRTRENTFFVYMTATVDHIMPKEVENRIFRHNRIFIHTCKYKKPMLDKIVELKHFLLHKK